MKNATIKKWQKVRQEEKNKQKTWLRKKRGQIVMNRMGLRRRRLAHSGELCVRHLLWRRPKGLCVARERPQGFSATNQVALGNRARKWGVKMMAENMVSMVDIQKESSQWEKINNVMKEKVSKTYVI